MALFSKRLTCFYCGRRSPLTVRGPVRKFHCDLCEADNYLDENGEITDPPAADTNPFQSPSSSSPPFESTEFRESDLFCSQCLRNQHLLTNSLANYFPPTDDPSYPEYERNYEQFYRSQEARYPQVCESCEPRVRDRIRQTQYDAKADHLRRMMDQTRAGKAMRSRTGGWRSLLVYAGALGYWISVCGQLAWNMMGALTDPSTVNELETSPKTSPSFPFCAGETAQLRRIPGDCYRDLAPVAGLALIAGMLSLWWNPKLHMKVEGKAGRFVRLGEYYQVQLVTLVARCVFWALLKDSSANSISPTMSPALHASMIIFTILSTVVSRQVILYDTRPLVNWADNSWEKKPISSTRTSPVPDARDGLSPNPKNSSLHQRFPIERLADTLPSVTRAPAVPPPTPPPETDDMDWTPSAPQDIQPVRSVHQRDQPSVLNGPLPFYGTLPAAPRPPAWNSRTGSWNRSLDQVVERNPFHQSPLQPQTQWQHKGTTQDVVFKPPNFFPQSDYNSSGDLNGLDEMFERTLGKEFPTASRKTQSRSAQKSKPGTGQSHLVYQYLRLGSLISFLAAWTMSQNRSLLTGIHIETFALGSASLIAGFSLLEALKGPFIQWNGMEILVYITELVAVIILGGHLPRASFDREGFDRYGKLLLLFMTVQELLSLLALLRAGAPPAYSQSHQPTSPIPDPSASRTQSSPYHGAIPWSPTESSASSTYGAASFSSQPAAPPLSFSSSAGKASFSTALAPVQQYRLPTSRASNSLSTNPNHRKTPHSFTMSSLKASEPYSDYEQDSDNETVATTATTLTDATTRNIRYGPNHSLDYSSPFSPRRNDFGGIGGLSLEDRPSSRRITRSQTQHGLSGSRYPGRSIR